MKKVLFCLILSQLNYAQELIFSQLPKDQYNYFNTISVINDQNKGIFVADDFVLSQNTKIRKIKLYANVDSGFFDSQNLFLWTGSIYQETNGLPSAIPNNGQGRVFGLVKFPFDNSIVVTKDTNNQNIITVEFNLTDTDLPYVFEANKKYWLTIYPTVQNNSNFFAQKNFYWAASTSNIPNLIEAKIVDPNNYMGQGYTNWTNVSSASQGVSGMAFELFGEKQLSTDESEFDKKMKIYQNSTFDEVYVIGENVKEMILYNIDGKIVKKTNKKEMSLMSEPKGIYIIKVFTT